MKIFFLQKVMTRMNTITKMAYKDDSTIMAWELMNEPRCQADYSGRTINVREQLIYIDKINFTKVQNCPPSSLNNEILFIN